MKFTAKSVRGLLFLTVLPFLYGCAGGDSHYANPRGAGTAAIVDYSTVAGSYRGLLPCADCRGIETELFLGQDGTYLMSRVYRDKSREPFFDSGIYKIDEKGLLTLRGAASGEEAEQGGSLYLHNEDGRLRFLDMEGNPIAGDLEDQYLLWRLDERLKGSDWQLVELLGEEIDGDGQDPEAYYLRFSETHSEAGTSGEIRSYNARAGCNYIKGRYTAYETGRIEFSTGATTLMLCPDMEPENRLKQVLAEADSFGLQDGVLELYRARMAPLARFIRADS